jgi:sortase A
VETAERPATKIGTRRRSRVARIAGTLCIVAGLALVAWTLTVWLWQDPFTSIYTRWEQRELAAEQRRIVDTYRPAFPPPVRAKPVDLARSVEREAIRFRKRSATGAALGRIIVPRLGLNMVMVNGTDTATLKRGPGRDQRTYLPGEGELVYIAGHRTTYQAPFAKIDKLRRGDRVRLEMPYGQFEYVVTGHRIVDDQDLSVLKSHGREVVALQACHPRFFATQRYIVWAKPVRVTPRRGRPFVPPAAAKAA